MEDLDYSLIPKEVWQKFVSWFGIEELSRPIPRYMVEHGMYVKHCKVEVYLVEFKLALHPEVDSFVTKRFSRADTVGKFMVTNTMHNSVITAILHAWFLLTNELSDN